MGSSRVVIFVLVGVMLFSVVASGLFILAQNNQSATQNADANKAKPPCAASPSLATNKGQPEGTWSVKITQPIDKLEIQDIRVGTGKTAQVGDCVTVHYRLELPDGTPVPGNDTFGSSPISFDLTPGQLIEGWIKGIPGMKEGGLRRLLIPSNLGYGSRAVGSIPKDSNLVFDVELLKIENR